MINIKPNSELQFSKSSFFEPFAIDLYALETYPAGFCKKCGIFLFLRNISGRDVYCIKCIMELKLL